MSGSKSSLACSLALTGVVQANPTMALSDDGVRHPFAGVHSIDLGGGKSAVPMTVDELGDSTIQAFSTSLGVQVTGSGQVSTSPIGTPSLTGALYFSSGTGVTGAGTYIDELSQPGNWGTTRSTGF